MRKGEGITIDDYLPFEEIKCNLCKGIVLHNQKFPLTQEEKNRYICAECEEKFNEYRD